MSVPSWSPPRCPWGRPWDIVAVTLWTAALAASVTLPGVNQSPLRTAIAVPYLLVCPGYVVVAALFPQDDAAESASDHQRIGWWLRSLLTLGLSALVVSSIGYLLVVTDVGIGGPVATGVTSAFVLSVAVIAVVRRRLLNFEERYTVPVTVPGLTDFRQVLGAGGRVELAVNVCLVLSVVFLVSSLVFAAAVPRPSEQYTELYVLPEEDSVAGSTQGYPSDVATARNATIKIGVDNQEHHTEEYVLVVAYNVRTAASDGSQDWTELDRFTISLDHSENWSRSYKIPASLPDRPVKIAFRLFRVGESGSEPYRETHLLLGNASRGGDVMYNQRTWTPGTNSRDRFLAGTRNDADWLVSLDDRRQHDHDHLPAPLDR